jgi:hypothetical protein
MSMVGELTFFLGFEVKQTKEGNFLFQEKYTKDLLKRFKMEDCKPIKTLMPTNGHLDLDEGGNPVDLTLYCYMICSLLYLTASRPDIMFSVCMCARFLANPKEAHLSVVKRILRYLKHTPSISLWYPKGANFDLVGYSDSDYDGCKIDRKSTSRGCHLLVRSLVSSHRKSKIVLPCQPQKQNTLSWVLVAHCRRGNSPAGWRNAPALNPKMRRGLSVLPVC